MAFTGRTNVWAVVLTVLAFVAAVAVVAGHKPIYVLPRSGHALERMLRYAAARDGYTACFNSATALAPWKLLSGGHAVNSHTLGSFNSATALAPWIRRSQRRNQCADKFPPASIRPRRWRRGNKLNVLALLKLRWTSTLQFGHGVGAVET